MSERGYSQIEISAAGFLAAATIKQPGVRTAVKIVFLSHFDFLIENRCEM